MKLLYISSCHPTLEFNDLSLFTEMGIQCTSTGIYCNPAQAIDHLMWRENSIPGMVHNQEAVNIFKAANPTYYRALQGYNRPRLTIPKRLTDLFDVIICNSFSHYIEDNWARLEGSNVIWKTYGDSTPAQENNIKAKVAKGLRIIRGSENELKKPHCAGGEVIRCNIDENWFCSWNGTNSAVVSFQNAFHIRNKEAGGQAYLKVRSNMDCNFKLFGDHSKLHPLVQNFLTLSEQLKEYQNNQVYFAIGSHPAPVTYNFMEAMVTGIPVVTFGYKIGGASKGEKPSYYQIPKFIEHGVTGFVSDDLDELKSIIQELLDKEELRKSISDKGRAAAIKFWGKEAIKSSWKEYFRKEGLQ